MTIIPFDPADGSGTLLSAVLGMDLDATLVDGTIVVTAVPEPSTLLLAGVGGALLLPIFRRRGRSRPATSA